jgi:hypothetical protein
MGGTPELPPHRAARWAASVLICATLAVACVVVAVATAGVAHADQSDSWHSQQGGDQGSGDDSRGGGQGSGGGGDQGSSHDGGDQGSGNGGDQGSGGGDCGDSCGGGSGTTWAAPAQTPGNSGQVNHAPEPPQVPLPAPQAPQLALPVPQAPQVPMPAPAAPPARSHPRAGTPPAPVSKPIVSLQPRPQASPAPAAPTPVVLQQPAPVVRHAVRAPTAGNHRTAHRRRPRAHERHRRQATHRTITTPPVTAVVTPLRKEPPTGLGQPALPLLGRAVVAPAGDQPKLSLLVALPAVALLLPLLVVLFLDRRRY